MNARTSGRISKLLSTAGLVWCVGVSSWIWVTPIRSSGFSTQAWSSAGPAGTVSSGVRTVPVDVSRRFADISLLGAFPLAVPVMLAALATWAAWRNKKLLLLLATAALLAFCVLSGFSIGRGYVLGGGAMLWALLVRFDAEPERTPDVPARDDAI
jgi:hypothetical protein